MPLKIDITNGERDTVHVNPQGRNGRPIVSSSSLPSIIIEVSKEFDGEKDGEDFEERKIKELHILVNDYRFKYVRGINSDEIKRNLTLEKIEEGYLSNTGKILSRPYTVKVIVVDDNDDETPSEYFQIN